MAKYLSKAINAPDTISEGIYRDLKSPVADNRVKDNSRFTSMITDAIKDRGEWEERRNLCYDFYKGKQWSGDYDVYYHDKQVNNLIKPITNSMIASVYIRDPHIKVIPNNHNYARAASVLEILANSLWETTSANKSIKKAIKDAIITGQGYLKTIINNKGDILVEYIPCKRIFLDASVDRKEDAQYIIEHKSMSSKEIKERYSVNYEGKGKTDISVYELWIKGDSNYYIVTGEKVLKEIKNPFVGDIWNPYSEISIEPADEIYGYGKVWDLLGPQRTMNKMATLRMQHIASYKNKTLVNSLVLSPNSPKFQQLLSPAINEVIPVTGDPRTAITVAGGAQINPDLYQNESILYNYMQTISNVDATRLARISQSSASASEVSLVLAQAEQILSLIADEISDAIHSCVEKMLFLVRNWKVEDTIRVSLYDTRNIPEQIKLIEGYYWLTIDPELFTKDIDYCIHINAKDLISAKRMVETNNAIAIYVNMKDNPNINQRALSGWVLEQANADPDILLNRAPESSPESPATTPGKVPTTTPLPGNQMAAMNPVNISRQLQYNQPTNL